MRVGQSRVSDRGQTKCKHCIVISESWGVEVLTLRGLTKSMQCWVFEGFRQGLTKSMQFIVTSDMRFSTLRGMSKSMHCIVLMKKSSRAFSSGY